MSDEIFGEKQIRETVKNILREKTSKCSKEDYLSCIEMLDSLISIGEIKNEVLKEIIYGAIADFTRHLNLGTISDGKFKPIDCHIAARHNVINGNFISGNKFLVITKDSSERILEEPLTSLLPTDAIWDLDTKSLIHLRCYYLRHLDELMGISSSEIERLGLKDVFRDNFNKI
jgi:hypothetical protein